MGSVLKERFVSFGATAIAAVALAGCGSSGSPIKQPSYTTYTLTVNSDNPAGGVAVVASPADNSHLTGGRTALALNYLGGTVVTLTAPVSSGTTIFNAWTGCGTAAGNVCTVTVSSSTAVTAGYVAAPKGVAQVVVTPATQTVSVGTGLQLASSVGGTGKFDSSVTWSIAANGNSTLSPGTVSSNGFFQTPYPAPASVTVTATSNADPTVSGSAVISLISQGLLNGPSLSVDAAGPVHAISPQIYGMNEYGIDPSIQTKFNLPVDRWGGDATTRYNYKLDVTNSAFDYFFENDLNNNTNYPDTSAFNSQVELDRASKTTTVATVPLIGWTTKRVPGCSYSVAKYGAQTEVNPNDPNCGTGILDDGKKTPVANDPTDTSVAIDETFAKGWVQYLAGRYGTAANGGVGEYELDNEPEYWSGVHKDVHPASLTYDEVSNKAITYAAAIKSADPTAAVGGPVISSFGVYFYSWADEVSGWGTAPCYCYNGNPTDRIAHGDVPLVEYYLQQFKKYEDENGQRLLDYLDLHGYYAANNAAFALAGDTALQTARLDSTRAMWDPNYISGYTDPEVRSSNAPRVAVNLIGRMKGWVAKDYPGTKTAITEYNWGGQEHINGALAQADLLGIFGREGLDQGILWGPPDPIKQLPGLEAFLLYRNYDGAGSQFGDQAVSSTSSDQGKLAVYGAVRSSDGAITIMVINKTFGDLQTPLALTGVKAGAVVKVLQYSAARLDAIVPAADLAVLAPVAAGSPATVNVVAPASSITLLVIPKS